MKRILILGGSGFVGAHLCRQLAHADVRLTVPSRQAALVGTDSASHVRYVQADVLNPGQLKELVSGHDTAINLVAILHGTAPAFERVHVEFPALLARCCAESSVHHLIHVSALGADAKGPSMYQRSKGRGEAALEQVCALTGLPITVLRPSVIFGQDDQFLNIFARLQRFGLVVPLAGAATRFQPVWVEDVAHALAELALSGPRVDKVYEACGPDVFTLAELVRHAGRWAGCARPILALSPAWGKRLAAVMEHLPGKPLMSRDNVDSLRVDNVASGKLPGLSALGISPTPLARVFPIE